MTDDSLLRMPEHDVHSPLDGFNYGQCKGSKEPGYAQQMMDPFGHLHCNACGWVTPEQVALTYSPETDRHYLTWEDLLAAEANGWVVIGTSSRRDTAPVVVGPYETREEAEKARPRLRRKWQREERLEHGPGIKISTAIRALWKEQRRG